MRMYCFIIFILLFEIPSYAVDRHDGIVDSTEICMLSVSDTVLYSLLCEISKSIESTSNKSCDLFIMNCYCKTLLHFIYNREYDFYQSMGVENKRYKLYGYTKVDDITFNIISNNEKNISNFFSPTEEKTTFYRYSWDGSYYFYHGKSFWYINIMGKYLKCGVSSIQMDRDEIFNYKSQNSKMDVIWLY